MPSIIACPSCQKQLKVPDELIGRNVKCPGCKETFTAQAMSKSAPPQEEIAEKPRKRAAPPPEEEEEEEAPRKPVKRRAAADDDDEEEEERPSRRRGGGPMAPHRGMLVLLLGIGSLALNLIGLFPLPLFIGPVAWILGNMDLKAMNEGRMDPEGRGQTQIGKILGIVATVLLILSVIGICLLIILWITIFSVAVSNIPTAPKVTFPR